jgi:hypothetical protein
MSIDADNITDLQSALNDAADVMAEPMFAPSTLNWTFATATLSEAVAERETAAPPTVAPFDGAVREAVGGVVSGVGAGVDDGPPPKII